MVGRRERGKSLIYKLLWLVGVKFEVLVSFFINGENQEEGSNAINVERRGEEFEGLGSLISKNATPF